jgi:hypothetical protein
MLKVVADEAVREDLAAALEEEAAATSPLPAAPH